MGYSNGTSPHLQPAQSGSQSVGGGYLSRTSSGDSNGSAAGMLRGGQSVPRRYGPTVYPSSTSSSRAPSPLQSPDLRARNSDFNPRNSDFSASSINSKGGYAKGAAALGGLAYGGKASGNQLPGSPGNLTPSISDKFSLSADPGSWGADVSPASAEADDYLHNPDPKRDRKNDHGGTIFTVRGLANVGTIVILCSCLIVLFAGWPIISAVSDSKISTLGAYNLGGVNATGQVASTIGNFGLIDQDTPTTAYYHTSLETGSQWELVFSDEFNKEGRTFYEGDDPFWQAEDMHYWSTNNLEWYEPRRLTTEGGSLKVTLDKFASHGLNYEGGLMNTWNKFCFRGGYVETSVSLPGTSDVYGLWPAIWTMGNLGRAGYGGTLESMWPYSYDTCDIGTLSNQTLNGAPEIALTSGPSWSPYNGTLSYLEGQRLSACSCPGDTNHPGPKKSDGTWTGRSAPEIDILEAQVDHSTLIGGVSQSAQWAPFNPYYEWVNTSSTYDIFDASLTALNSYAGGVYQQATSAVTTTNQQCYTGDTGCFSIYGFEYAPGDTGYIRWVSDNKPSWLIRGAAMAANTAAQVGQRPIPYEPMYLLINLGLSENFGVIDYDGLESLWPVHMLVDYVRVYQDPSNKMLGCDPEDMPTAAYIASISEAYSNPNITTWDQIPSKPTAPKNRLVDTC